MLTYLVTVELQPWNDDKNDDGIKDMVIDDFDFMDAFDIVPISRCGTLLSRLSLLATQEQPTTTTIPQTTMLGTEDGNNNKHIINMKKRVQIGNGGASATTKKKDDDQAMITSKKRFSIRKKTCTKKRSSTRIRKIPNWMKDYVLFF
ncbi:unnamed protein product [Trifolium pratense]|uniref:Uncharacterized protein n=1 Tax=Trifolium pratense TaxID=57577 RepID=A0ACB0JJ77_TRIPR|nr:unnamed protein product [Trifolium pratense]